MKKEIDPKEQMTLDFLRENDPLFLKKNKKKLMTHPYLSAKQLKTRSNTEIPISVLSVSQSYKAIKALDCIPWKYDEVIGSKKFQ
jgi:hypothetical protein